MPFQVLRDQLLLHPAGALLPAGAVLPAGAPLPAGALLPAGAPLPTSWPRLGRGGASFSDDVTRPDGGRLGVRVRLTDREGGGYCVDLRDSDERDPSGRFGVARARTHAACVLALAHALGEAPGRAWLERLEILCERETWVGLDDDAGHDPAAIAHGMARTFDAVLGALANAWPGRVGAGSCSLGAVVELRTLDAEDGGAAVMLTEVLPGGEGGRPDRPASSAWSGPILASPWPNTPELAGVTLEAALREGSGGDGKHRGGEGVVRRYLVHEGVQRPLLACVAFDRVRNPPHGIDRAGPPLGTEVWLRASAAGRPRAVEPWSLVELGPGSCLEVLTCGGAGWGFPGYGDIDWDPSEWFGGKPKTA